MPDIEVGKELPRNKGEGCDYNVQAAARAFWRLSDQASHTYARGLDATGNPIIRRLPAEEPDDYEWRQSMAVSPRHVSSIISLFNSIVCREEAERAEGPEGSAFTALSEDADGMGTPLPRLMAQQLRLSQVEGVAYLLADTTASESYDSIAAQLGASVRPVIQRVCADQVLWWNDWRGQVVEAIILLEDKAGVEFAWYTNETHQQRIEIKRAQSPDGQPSLTVMGIGPLVAHRYGGCPLVRINPTFGSQDAPGNDSQAAPIAEAQKLITGYRSLEAIEVHKSTYTMYALMGVSPEQVGKSVAGSNRVLCLPQGTSVFRMGSDPAQAQSIRDSITEATASMLTVAGLSPGNPLQTGAPESGVAKAYKFNEVEARLSALADAAEHAENLVRKRALAGVGAEDYGDCNWPDSFMSPDLTADLEYTIRLLTAPLPAVLKEQQTKLFAQGAFDLEEDEQRELNAQIEQASADAEAMKENELTNPGGTVGT
jgi:hypothetical protein